MYILEKGYIPFGIVLLVIEVNHPSNIFCNEKKFRGKGALLKGLWTSISGNGGVSI